MFPVHTLSPAVTSHTHACGEEGIFVNAYLVETASAVVAVDATLTMSTSRAFRQRLDNLGKPLAAVLVTHPHPDHVAGLVNLVTDDATPIYATAPVQALMRQLEAPKRAQWTPVFGAEWVPQWRYPNRTVVDNEVVQVDGVSYTVHDLGRGGDSEANSIWVATPTGAGIGGAAFLSDLLFNGVHSYLADGGVLAWLANLERCRALCSGIPLALPGHGPAGTPDALIDRQRDYLLHYCAQLQMLAGDGRVDDEVRTRLTGAMARHAPGAGLEFLVGMSADAVWAELKQHAA